LIQQSKLRTIQTAENKHGDRFPDFNIIDEGVWNSLHVFLQHRLIAKMCLWQHFCKMILHCFLPVSRHFQSIRSGAGQVIKNVKMHEFTNACTCKSKIIKCKCKKKVIKM